jgi:hypothetical protein
MLITSTYGLDQSTLLVLTDPNIRKNRPDFKS